MGPWGEWVVLPIVVDIVSPIMGIELVVALLEVVRGNGVVPLQGGVVPRASAELEEEVVESVCVHCCTPGPLHFWGVVGVLSLIHI